jgi:hypothetical protein
MSRVSRIVVITCLCAVSSLLLAQTVTEVNTVGVDRNSPAVRIVGGTGASASALGSNPLQITLSAYGPSAFRTGDRLDYEVLITNVSSENVVLPQSLSWAEVAEPGAKRQKYVEASLSITLTTDEGGSGSFPVDVTLYGTPSRPSTLVVLKPGDSMRIQARSTLIPNRLSGLGEGPERAHLRADFAADWTELDPASVPKMANAYRFTSTPLYWAQSANHLEVEFSDLK